MSKVLLENIPLPDLDDPKSVVHRQPHADKKQDAAKITEEAKLAAKVAKETSKKYRKLKKARASKIRKAKNLALVHKLLPGRLLFSKMKKNELTDHGNVPCVYWARHLLTSMHREGRASGLYRLYVLGEVTAEVLASAAAESRLKIWGADLFPANSGGRVVPSASGTSCTWGLGSLHRILGAADDADRADRGVVSEDGSALTKMSASSALEAGVEIKSSAVGTGTEGMYKHIMLTYQEEVEHGHRDPRHFRQRDLTQGTKDLGTERGNGFRSPVDVVVGRFCRRQLNCLWLQLTTLEPLGRCIDRR
jgi:hypothetical protein